MRSKIIYALILSCKRSTELKERAQIESVDWMARFRMNLHVRICSACQQYEIQDRFLDQILKQEIDKDLNQYTSSNAKIPENIKAEIIEKIRTEK